MKKNKNVLIGICGSIAAYKVCDLIRMLKKKNYNVTCMMTEEAKRFVTADILQYLSSNRVYTDMFDVCDKIGALHISLAQWADVIVIIPATAHIISKLTAGLADCLLSCTILAANLPVVICPAMHESMYKKEIIQQNIKELKKRKYKFIGPVKGPLLEGQKAEGHIADIDDIAKTIEDIIK
jgi:phosphopantothenoylcysteine synthetase/decarboxylase